MKRFTMKRISILELAIALVIVLGIGGYFWYNYKLTSPRKVSAAGTLSTCADSDAVALVKPNVVKIENKTDGGTTIGSGFFDSSGYLVTNSHIVDKKGSITAYYPDGTQSKVILVSNSISKDLALLAPDKAPVKFLLLADKLELKEPDPLMAIGYPLNLPGEASVTKGSFSAKRNSQGIDYVQTDTALNSGNSGGPLINSCGQVVGINTLSVTNGSINLAIASNSAKSIIEDLAKNKKVEYLSGERKSVLSDMLKSVGYEISESEAIADSAAASANSTTPVATSTSKTASSGTTKKPSNPTSSKCPTTGLNITVQKTTIEIGEKATVYSTGYGTVSWAGPGTFEVKTNQNAYWSSDSAGTFNISATYTLDGTKCNSNTVTMTVLTPPTRIEGLAAIGVGGMEATYSNRLNTNAIRFGFFYRDKYGADLAQRDRRIVRVPISATVKMYKLTFRTGETERLIYSKTFSNSEIGGAYGYSLDNSMYREILVPRGDISVTDSDYVMNDDGVNAVTCSYEVTINTPEQGSFTFSATSRLAKY